MGINPDGTSPGTSQLGSSPPLVEVSVGNSPVGSSPVGVELGVGVPEDSGPLGRPLDELGDGEFEPLGAVLPLPVELDGGFSDEFVVPGPVPDPVPALCVGAVVDCVPVSACCGNIGHAFSGNTPSESLWIGPEQCG
jgi:hypothetical protein